MSPLADILQRIQRRILHCRMLRVPLKMQIAIRVVLYDQHIVRGTQLQHFLASGQTPEDSTRICEARRSKQHLGPVLADLGTQMLRQQPVPVAPDGNDHGTLHPQGLQNTRRSRILYQHAVSGINIDPGQQINRLLTSRCQQNSACGNRHPFGLQPVSGQPFAKWSIPFRITILQRPGVCRDYCGSRFSQ
ncbi:hypothetical protein D3C73_618690 [compost metagenome]